MSSFEIETAADTVRLRLSREVTIEQARALHTALAAALVPPRRLILDVAELTRLDCAALQVLLAAAQVASRAQLDVPSAAWTDALARLGATDPFLKP